jgi:hypothetical protein
VAKNTTKKEIPINKFKTFILAIVIAVVLTGFVIYLIQAIHPSPKYEDYCNNVVPIPIEKQPNINQSECELYNGIWIPQNIQCITTPCPQGYCNFYERCNNEYQKSQDNYNLLVFIISIVTGIIAISLGIILTLPSVSSGLMIGGTFLIIYGTLVYWHNLSNFLRAIILGLALIILIWLGYKKLKN